MTDRTHYDILEVPRNASQAEIKQAYRRQAMRFHPDRGCSDRNQIVSINAAYAILGDPQARSVYDLELTRALNVNAAKRHARSAAAAQTKHRHTRTDDDRLDLWFRDVYDPVERAIGKIASPLKRELDALAADPFDDRLMDSFVAYLENARVRLGKAKQTLASRPNPMAAARTAAQLYYCLDRLSDGLDELGWFTQNYDEQRLHDGREMFRIARGLRGEAREAARSARS